MKKRKIQEKRKKLKNLVYSRLQTLIPIVNILSF